MKVTTTTVTQTANEVLGTKEKTLHYLILENELGKKYIINVGEKTTNEVKKLIEEENEMYRNGEAIIGGVPRGTKTK